MAKQLFVVGTGTDIGKTYVSGLLAKKMIENGKNIAYFKAAMSGNDRREDQTLIPGDALQVKTMSGSTQSLEEMCPYVYEHAYSPHLASRIEGNPVTMQGVQEAWQVVYDKYEYVLMEGSGGILCPLCFDEAKINLEDIILMTKAPCLLVADAGLGTINQVVLTIRYMESKNIPVQAILFNHFHPGNIMEEDNLHMCEYLTGKKVITCIEENTSQIPLKIEELVALFE